MEFSSFVGALQNASTVKAFLLDEQIVSILSAIGDTHLEAATRDLKSARTARNPEVFISGARTNLRTSQVAYEELINRRGDMSSHFQLASTSLLHTKLVFTISLQIMCAVYLVEKNEAEVLLNSLKKPIDMLHRFYHGPDTDESLGGIFKSAVYFATRGSASLAGFLNPNEWKSFVDSINFEFEVERWPRDTFKEFKEAVQKRF